MGTLSHKQLLVNANLLISSLPMYRQCIAGGAAGFCQIIVTTPMELLKIQMQDAGRTSGERTFSLCKYVVSFLQIKE